MVKTNPKRTLERSVLRWGLANWYKIGWALFGGYFLYMTHSFLTRFLAFTEYVYTSMEEHKAPPVTPVDPPNTQN